MDDLLWLDATAQAELVRSGEVAAGELVDAAIARIERLDPRINAVILRRFERVREEARGGLPDGPFRGVPFLVKDSLCQIAGEPHHAAMRALKDAGYRSSHDSYLGARYKRAGFAILGKSNLSELALSPITDSVAYGPTRNPWDLRCTAGGSSGGAAAAVAAGFVPVAHGGDSGGSIRIPASACGVVGLKPSRGRITLGPDFGERFGQKSCEHVLTRSVRDSAAVLDACAGAAPGDPSIAPPPVRPWRDEVGADPGRLRIGFRTLRADERGWDAPCAAAVASTAALLADLGHEVEDDRPACLDVLEDRSMIETMHVIKYVHVASELARLGALIGRELGAGDVEPNTWSAADAARHVSGVQLMQAMAEQHRYARRLAGWWEGDFDILVTPTLATLPFRFKESGVEPGRLRKLDLSGAGGEDKPLGLATFTGHYNLSGQPAISLPLHWSGDGVPVGVQFIAAYGREDLLFRLAGQLETARPWAHRRPPAVTPVTPV